jgi:hypothetical protein
MPDQPSLVPDLHSKFGISQDVIGFQASRCVVGGGDDGDRPNVVVCIQQIHAVRASLANPNSPSRSPSSEDKNPGPRDRQGSCEDSWYGFGQNIPMAPALLALATGCAHPVAPRRSRCGSPWPRLQGATISLKAHAGIPPELGALPALFELPPVPIPQQTLYARNASTWRASFSSVW